MPYAKLDSGIIFSTVWREPHTTLRVWITLLAMKDRNGEVRASVPGLADAARVTLPECQAALATFRAPDEFSRTQEHEGRRIQDIPGGWLVINHELYRQQEDAEDRREKTAARVQRFRERQKHGETNGAFRSAPRAAPERRNGKALQSVTVTPGNAGNAKKRHADTDADADAESTALTTFGRDDAFEDAWTAYPHRLGGNSKLDARKAWDASLKRTGVTARAMLDGTMRYAEFIRVTDKEGTEFVKQARTFFGPGEHWREGWATAAPKKSPGQRFLDSFPEHER